MNERAACHGERVCVVLLAVWAPLTPRLLSEPQIVGRDRKLWGCGGRVNGWATLYTPIAHPIMSFTSKGAPRERPFTQDE